jgi:hypothetical protein
VTESPTDQFRAARDFLLQHRTDYDADGLLEYAQHLNGDNSLLETKAGKAEGYRSHQMLLSEGMK